MAVEIAISEPEKIVIKTSTPHHYVVGQRVPISVGGKPGMYLVTDVDSPVDFKATIDLRNRKQRRADKARSR